MENFGPRKGPNHDGAGAVGRERDVTNRCGRFIRIPCGNSGPHRESGAQFGSDQTLRGGGESGESERPSGHGDSIGTNTATSGDETSITRVTGEQASILEVFSCVSEVFSAERPAFTRRHS